MLSFHQVAELQDLQQDLPAFQQRLQELLTRLDLSLINYHADHVSVRCFQQATAERWRSGFMQCATLISEKEINGRPICLFSLHEPLQVGEWDIDCVELPYQEASYIHMKAGSMWSGWYPAPTRMIFIKRLLGYFLMKCC